MDSKLEAHAANLEARMDAKFTTLIQVLTKEKNLTTGEETIHDKTPILPTSCSRVKNRCDDESGDYHKRGKPFLTGFPRIELPMFSGENPKDWLRKYERFFSICQIPEHCRIDTVELYLEGKVDVWYQSLKFTKRKLSWGQFAEDLVKRFGEKGGRDEVEEFNKLQQVDSVARYQEEFESLRSLLLAKNPCLTEQYFVSSFISGLKEELKPMVRLMKPPSLLEAFEVAQLQEQSLEVLFKKQKMLTLGKNLPPVSKGPSTYKVPTTAEMKPPSTNNLKRISLQKLQKRRKKGLCFKCGEKYGMGHQCKMKHLNFLLLDEDLDPDGEDILAEIEEAEKDAGAVVEASLYTLSGNLSRKTIMLQGKLLGHLVNILVDTGSSDSYIHSQYVNKLNLKQTQVAPFSVIIADGSIMTSHNMCPKIKWEVQGSKFCFDLKSMDVGIWDNILGVDWMTYYSPITFDFRHMTIQLVQEGEKLLLQGHVENPELKVVRGKDLKEFRKVQSAIMQVNTPGQALDSGNSAALPSDIVSLLEQFACVFDVPSTLPPPREFDHQIPLKPDS